MGSVSGVGVVAVQMALAPRDSVLRHLAAE